MENSVFLASGSSNLEQILGFVNISASSDILKGYLSEIFKDLEKKSFLKNQIGLQAFQTYLDFPLIISQKFFHALDSEVKGYLKRNQFIDGLFLMSCGFMQLRIRMVFQIFDIDSDGIINKDDITLLLSHFHMISNNVDISILERLIENFCAGRLTFTLFEFSKAVSVVNSDVFLLFLFYYAKYKPYDEKVLQFYSIHASTNMHNEDGSISPNVRKRNTMIDKLDKSQFKSFTNLSTDFANFVKVRKLSDATQCGYFPVNEEKSNLIAYPSEGLFQYINGNFNMTLQYTQCEAAYDDLNDLNTFEEEMRTALKVIKESSHLIEGKEDNNEEMKDRGGEKDREENRAYSQSSFEMKIKQLKFFVSRTSGRNENISSYDINDSPGKLARGLKGYDDSVKVNPILKISISSKSENESESTNASLFFETNKPQIPVNETIVYILSPKEILKKYKIVLFQSNLFYFKYNTNSSTKPIFSQIQTLKATYITSCIQSTINNENYYMVTLTSYFTGMLHTSNVYFSCEEDMLRFEYCFNHVTNYRRLTDVYQIEEEIGHGQFGRIRLGINKKTGEKVAIKIIKKVVDNPDDMKMIRWECDIVKFLIKADHPGLIKGKDYFETCNSIYLVFDFIPGGNLNSYLWSIQEVMTRHTTEMIISQILESMKYLHKFGIVHRDLKPDNILICPENENNHFMFQTKLIDFGLSQVMSNHETTGESYGTLCYSPPEVILKRDYNYKVDLWSFGVLVFYLYFATLPFDDPDNNLAIIAKKIVWAEVPFPEGEINENARLLIQSCLQKNCERRPELDELSKLLSKPIII